MADHETVDLSSEASDLAKLLARPESEWTLCQAALLAAREINYPNLDVAKYESALTEAGNELSLRVPVDASTRFRLAALNEHMFQTLGFAGDTEEYYDPRNSYLNEVIDRRLGIPLTLSLVYMELGGHLGLDLRGLSFPGHFLVKVDLDDGIAVLDPFHSGVSLDQDELQRRLSVGHTSGPAPPLNTILRDAGRREILIRMLRNLKLVYLQQENWELALAVCNALVTSSEREPGELRDRGLVLDHLECPAAALSDLEEYLAGGPDSEDSEDIQERLQTLRNQVKPPN